VSSAKLPPPRRGNDPRGRFTTRGNLPSARATAFRLLSRRDYTTAELRDRLLARGFDARETDSLIDTLTADGTLDDRRVAAAHVRTAGRVKGRGRLRIVRELAARGIDRDDARELVRDFSAEDEAESIARVLARKHVPARPSAAERRRIVHHLLRRGFPGDAIAQALRRHGREE
jgi:regulatory protein